MGFPCSEYKTCGRVRLRLCIGGFYWPCMHNSKGHTNPRTLWSSISVSFRLSHFTMVSTIQCVSHTALPLVPLRLLLADSAFPRGSAYSFLRVRFRQLHTGQLLILHVSVGAVDGSTGSKNSFLYATSRRNGVKCATPQARFVTS